MSVCRALSFDAWSPLLSLKVYIDFGLLIFIGTCLVSVFAIVSFYNVLICCERFLFFVHWLIMFMLLFMCNQTYCNENFTTMFGVCCYLTILAMKHCYHD